MALLFVSHIIRKQICSYIAMLMILRFTYILIHASVTCFQAQLMRWCSQTSSSGSFQLEYVKTPFSQAHVNISHPYSSYTGSLFPFVYSTIYFFIFKSLHCLSPTFDLSSSNTHLHTCLDPLTLTC